MWRHRKRTASTESGSAVPGFDGGTRAKGRATVAKSMAPPQYPDPRAACRHHWHRLRRVARGHDGKVADAVVERVNLRIVGSDRQMQRAGNMLRDAAVWPHAPVDILDPHGGRRGGCPYWDIRVPVTFWFGPAKAAAYGKWDTYVPGPSQPLLGCRGQGPGSDALAAGGIYPVGAGPGVVDRLAERRVERPTEASRAKKKRPGSRGVFGHGNKDAC